jgi:DNA-binding XRE family transcriptional regulator
MKKIIVKQDLESIRIRQGLTSVDLAKKCNVSSTAIRSIEKKENNASPAIAVAISEALNTPFDDLFNIVDGEGE